MSSTATVAPSASTDVSASAASVSSSSPAPAAAPAPGTTKKCSQCAFDRPTIEYSGAQLKKQGKRVCSHCLYMKTPVKKGMLQGIKNGNCYLIRTKDEILENGERAPPVHIYQDTLNDQFAIVSNLDEPIPTLNDSGELTFEGVPGVRKDSEGRLMPPSFGRYPVGSTTCCARPFCPHWQPQMNLGDEKTVAHQFTEPKGKLIPCKDCQAVFYCSSQCMEQHLPQHSIWCRVKKLVANPTTKRLLKNSVAAKKAALAKEQKEEAKEAAKGSKGKQQVSKDTPSAKDASKPKTEPKVADTKK